MLHDWAKVLESPVFRNGFKPMTGHNDLEVKGNGEKEKERKRKVGVSEHAELHMRREKETEAQGKIELAAN